MTRKQFPLRIDAGLWEDLEAWAADELRSVNGQIEYLLREAVRRRKGGVTTASRDDASPEKGRDMRDPRLDVLAANLLDYSLAVKAGEKVLIEGETGAEELMIALVEAAYRRGVVPFVTLGDARLRRACLLGAKREQMDLQVAWEMHKVGDVEACIHILAGDNASQMADIPSGHARGLPTGL